MILKRKFSLLAVAMMIIAAACTENKPISKAEQPHVDNSTPHQSANPFHFYKDIEIKPGLHFEVISWGRGVDTLGGIQILRSDSLKNEYRSVSLERQGKVTDAWNLDLDNDGSPEIYIQTEAHPNRFDLMVYEYGNDFEKLSFPGLKSMKGYEGGDKFFVKSGELFRTVPIVQVDSAAKSTLVKTLRYRLAGNQFSSVEVKDEP